MIDQEKLFISYAFEDRHTPRVRMNFVTSADGAATNDGRSGALGGPGDRALMKVLRTMTDVVLVGAGTVRAEGYGGLGLPEEAQQWRLDHDLTESPRLALVSRDLDLDAEMSVFRKAERRPIVVTCASSDATKRDQLATVADVLVFGEDEVDLSAALGELTHQGMSQVLCEGGPHLFGSLLEADLVDEVCLTISPMFVGGDAGRISASPSELLRSYRVASLLSDDDEFIFVRYVRAA